MTTMKALRRGRRGFTFVELVISVGVASLMFAFLGYLTIFTGRNFVTLHEQLVSQTSAAAAQERMVRIMRGAVGFERFSGDTSATVTRIKAVIPTGPTTTANYVAAYDSTDRTLKIFTTDANLTFSGGGVSSSVANDLAWEFHNIETCEFNYETSFRITVTTGYRYRGTGVYAPGNPQYGRFVTDIIAKNHFLDQGVTNYELDLGTVGPATL